MKTKLKPPEGFDSWLDYAVASMDTRQLYLSTLADDNSGHWGKIVSRDEMSEAAHGARETCVS